jgi:hypothetical protein
MNEPHDARTRPIGARCTLAILLGCPLAVTGFYLFASGQPAQLLSPVGAVQTIVNSTASPVLQRAGIPSPVVDPSIAQQAHSVAGKSMTIADKALHTVDVTVDTGDRVVRFGAGLIDQVLPPSSASGTRSDRAANVGGTP